MQNGRVVRLNRTYRAYVLNCYLFETLGEVRQTRAVDHSLQRVPSTRVARQSLAAAVLDGNIPFSTGCPGRMKSSLTPF
jgi:hypothetical protein